MTTYETLYHVDHGATLKHKCGKKIVTLSLLSFSLIVFIWAFYDEDMTTLDTTKNIAYMYIREVISNANYAIIYLCHPGQKYFTNICAMSNCRCMIHLYNPHVKIRGKLYV